MKLLINSIACATLVSCQPAYSEMKMVEERLLSEQTVRYICGTVLMAAALSSNDANVLAMANAVKDGGEGSLPNLINELYMKDAVRNGAHVVDKRLQQDALFCRYALVKHLKEE